MTATGALASNGAATESWYGGAGRFDRSLGVVDEALALRGSGSGVVVTGAFAAPAWGGETSPCQPHGATGHDAATSPAGPYVGIENITIGKTIYSGVPVVTTIVAPLTPEGDSGILTTTTSHAITLPSGTITTTDDVHLIPTQTPGVYKLVSHLVVTAAQPASCSCRGR